MLGTQDPFRSAEASAHCDATLPIAELAAEGRIQSAIMLEPCRYAGVARALGALRAGNRVGHPQ